MAEYVIEFTRRNVQVVVCGDDEEAVAKLGVLLADEHRRYPHGQTVERRVGKVLPLDPWSRRVG